MTEDKKAIALKVLDDMNLRTVDVISALGKVFNGADNDQDYRVVNALGTDAIRQFNFISTKICKVHLELIALQDCINKTKEFIEK